MITLTILLIVALLCVLVGCLTGLLTLVGVLASLFVGVLVGALAGYLAGRFMGTETSLGRNILMGVLGSFVGEFLFGLLGIHASGSFSSFAISVVGACICIWIVQKISKSVFCNSMPPHSAAGVSGQGAAALLFCTKQNPRKPASQANFRGFFFGATDLIRTGDLLITSELLYQLSHSSTLHICCNRQYFTIFLRHCQGRISCKRSKLLQGVSQKVIAF